MEATLSMGKNKLVKILRSNDEQKQITKMVFQQAPNPSKNSQGLGPNGVGRSRPNNQATEPTFEPPSDYVGSVSELDMATY
mmetsp:Transcript_41568/g.63436  ORF Transcript_41568/g.63436 Transcript_41568/m.63436 type:complete len:81 (+) Transcript_41568:1541-1783(+)